jgi:sortase (surface protein transpeptidase)
VLDPGNGSILTLTTCHPPGSAEQRLIVRAKLSSSEILA